MISLTIRFGGSRLQILLEVSRRHKGKFTRQTFFIKKARDFAGLVHFGQCKAGQSQACRGYRCSDLLFRGTPHFENMFCSRLIAANLSHLL